ncbi:MAG TPA: hypothetical protein VMU10_11975 [Desulfomonilia bacterium]|nr:hypothetical protein [Desulfomonilia bacterium]
MKKDIELRLAGKENDNDRSDIHTSSRKDLNKRKAANDNIYMDTIKALLEKNRNRVAQYYCANRNCPTQFWASDLGYVCPQCGSIGIISRFKADTAYEENPYKPVVGYLDSIGRLFCTKCTERFGISDDVGLVIYNDSEPYNSESCEACRTRLDSPA